MRVLHDDFVRQVQRRGKLADRTEAMRAIRITFEVLADRLTVEQSDCISIALGPRVAVFLQNGIRMGANPVPLGEQWQHIAERERMGAAQAANQACSVLDVLGQCCWCADSVIAELRALLAEIVGGT